MIQQPITAGIAADEFRAAMRHFAGNVSVVTVGSPGERSGLVATSAVSLSTDPAMVIVCVNRDSSSWPLFDRYGHFGVNSLTAAQQPIADRFTGRGGIKGEDRYAIGNWSAGMSGAPLLADAAVALDCVLDERIDRATHSILVGRVLEARLREDDAGALVYWRGAYHPLGADLQG